MTDLAAFSKSAIKIEDNVANRPMAVTSCPLSYCESVCESVVVVVVVDLRYKKLKATSIKVWSKKSLGEES